ncbi:MAG: SLC13 family permease [Bacillota bacterium]|nr:SLC13 family permease [Bacillota bacterium]
MDLAQITVLIILSATIIIFVFDIVRIDIAALLCMLALGWTGILTPQETLDGFSSNAVIAIMAVMILGQGVAKTGLMERYSQAVMKKVGTGRSRLIVVMSLSAGVLSAFVQNIGSAALFLPGILDISRRGKIPAAALIMPLGFAAILGGTLSMVGSSSLIIVNDLLRSANMEPYGLFSVTPVGLLLLLSGTAFFFFCGKYVLPDRPFEGKLASDQEKLIKTLNLPNQIWHYSISESSDLIGLTTEQSGVWDRYNLHILGLSNGNEVAYAPWRETNFQAGQQIALLGDEKAIKSFTADYELVRLEQAGRLALLTNPEKAGFAEVIIPSRSELVSQTIRQYGLRKRYAIEPLLLFSKGEKLLSDFSDHQIIPGDTFIVHGLWENISSLKSSSNFVVATQIKEERTDQSKALVAALCFLVAIVLAMTGSAPISLSFFTGAIAMVLTGVLTIQEAYRAIEWKVIFLLAGLIPLGVAMQKTGTAVLLAEKMMSLIHGEHPIILVLSIAVLSTLLSLVISNVGTVVVLTPLVVSMAAIGGLDPRPLALMAALCATNSFILPTHQVNALLMSSGGYRNADYLKAGSGMTIIFLTVVVLVFYLFYL